ncbi:MAG: hypothetical protein RR485_06080 [Mucinivorans sp.]
MRKTLFIALISLVCLSAAAARKKPIATVQDVDSLITVRYRSYDTRREALNKEYQATSDSLEKIRILQDYNKIDQKCVGEVVDIYGKYSSVAGVVERLYALRTSVAKDQLSKIMQRIPQRIKESDPYVSSLKRHLDFNQVTVGDTVSEFKAKTARGDDFRFGELVAEKDILLVFGDWNDSSIDTKRLLDLMYRKIDLSKLEIVNVFSQMSKDDFIATVQKSEIGWLAVCDFRGDHSPLKIAFGVQSTPMCFYIKKGGEVQAISIGISGDILMLVSEQNYGK